MVRVPAEATLKDVDDPPHDYRTRPLHDPFTLRMADLSSGKVPLDRRNEKAFVESLLRLFEIPVSSQLLVFSTTSLQLSLISPSNPRALYFNEEVYVGYIPGGRIEIVSLDPDLGGIFYIFDIPKDDRPLSFERSDRCMKCHARDDTGQVPGLVAKSVIPGPGGGSLTAYRIGQSGHAIPLDQRFGGWHVTGTRDWTNHLGNFTGVLADGKLTKIPNPPGAHFRWDRYLADTSDLLPHLVHEHQIGFVNRVVRATYLTREFLAENGGTLTDTQSAELDAVAHDLVRYLLFADEAPLPPGGSGIGDSKFQTDFLRTRKATSTGQSLKDLELTSRLFQYRCSYMIYSPVFSGLPAPMKNRVYAQLGRVLRADPGPGEFAYLPKQERQAIRSILQSTLPDLPAAW